VPCGIQQRWKKCPKLLGMAAVDGVGEREERLICRLCNESEEF